jgi:hypothetical protein
VPDEVFALEKLWYASDLIMLIQIHRNVNMTFDDEVDDVTYHVDEACLSHLGFAYNDYFEWRGFP